MNIKGWIESIDKYDSEHDPGRRCSCADALVDELRDIFTDQELIEACAAKGEGRLKILDFVQSYDDAGLQHKYYVFKAEDGEVVDGCFVLRPDNDPAARAALLAYADATDNEELREDLRYWMEHLGRADQ